MDAIDWGVIGILLVPCVWLDVWILYKVFGPPADIAGRHLAARLDRKLSGPSSPTGPSPPDICSSEPPERKRAA